VADFIARIERLEAAIHRQPLERSEPKSAFDYERLAADLAAHMTIDARPRLNTPREEVRARVAEWCAYPAVAGADIEAEVDRIMGLSADDWIGCFERAGRQDLVRKMRATP